MLRPMQGALAMFVALLAAPAAPDVEARELFQDGQAKYDTHDYDGAIEAFTAAFASAEQIEDADVRDEALARLSFNLARAHVSAYDIDHDDEHLVLARRLLADYRGHERELGRDPDIDTDVQRLEAELAKRERARDEAKGASPSISPMAEKRDRTRRNAGISLLVLAAPFGGVAVAGALVGVAARNQFETVNTGDARRDAQTRGRTGDALFGIGIGLAVLSAATGATLLGISAKSKRSQVTARATFGGLVIEGAF
jgi:tetratricopeptide (TPR) repeat protein